MPDELLLRDKARTAIQNGTLPTRRQDLMLGGPGIGGEACAVCGERIAPDQAELEADFNQDIGPPGVVKYYFHPRCFAAWEFERTRIEGTSPAPQN